MATAFLILTGCAVLCLFVGIVFIELFMHNKHNEDWSDRKVNTMAGCGLGSLVIGIICGIIATTL